jgi:hypothetical protein
LYQGGNFNTVNQEEEGTQNRALRDITENWRRKRERVVNSNHEGSIRKERLYPGKKGTGKTKMSKFIEEFGMRDSIKCLRKVVIKDINILSSANCMSPVIETIKKLSRDRVTLTKSMLGWGKKLIQIKIESEFLRNQPLHDATGDASDGNGSVISGKFGISLFWNWNNIRGLPDVGDTRCHHGEVEDMGQGLSNREGYILEKDGGNLIRGK